MSLEGQQIDRYRIVRLLGSGGMGDVYLAEDARIEQQVAIKVIRAEVSPYPDAPVGQEAVRLFQREAKAIVKLDHPHILPLFDYGEERMGKMTVLYLVMPYRQEGSLADWLRERGQGGLLSPQQVVHFMSQAASALQHAHDRQIIHQDVKPSNFLLRHRAETPMHPDLLLGDFGIARFATATSSASQSIRGTPTAMAPEQSEGHPVPATDQYALAVMAYELLTGRPPFQGAPGPLMYQHLTIAPPPPSTWNQQLSRAIDTVLLHALAKQPEQRFASITLFANAFQQATLGMQETEAPTLPAAAPTLPSLGDIRAALAISTAEAQIGTTRTLTLPGGRQVRVSVPAGIQNGDVVRLDGQGEVSPAGGPSGALILTITVKTEQEAPVTPLSLSAEPTAMVESLLAQAQRAEEEQARKAEEEQAQKAREEQARLAEEEQARKAEEERARKAEEEQARQAEEERAQKAMERIRARQAEEERLRKAREEQARKAEEEQAQKALEEQVRKALEEAEEKQARKNYLLSKPILPTIMAFLVPGLLAVLLAWLVKPVVIVHGIRFDIPSTLAGFLVDGALFVLPFIAGITTTGLWRMGGRSSGLGCMSGILFGLIFAPAFGFADVSLGTIAGDIAGDMLLFGFFAYLGARAYLALWK